MNKILSKQALGLVDDILLLTLGGSSVGLMKQPTAREFQNFIIGKEDEVFARILAGYADAISETDANLSRLVGDLVTPENITTRAGIKTLKKSAQNDFLKVSKTVWGKKFSQEILDDINDTVRVTYEASKDFAATRVSPALVNPFTTIDERSLLAVDGQFETWMSTNYERVKDPRIRKILAQGFKETLDTESIARMLEDKLGNTYKDYKSWNQLASYQVNLARNVGQVRTYQQAEITVIEYAAVIDARTTPFCLDIDGKVVYVENVANHVDTLLALETPDDIIAFKPFTRSEEISSGKYQHYVGDEKFSFPRGNDAGRNSAALEKSGAILSPFHNLCYAKGTEVLTEDGWIDFEQISGTESFASLNPVTREIEYVEGIGKIEYEYQGKMIHFKNRNFDLLVTPDHNMAYIPSHRFKKKKGGTIVRIRSADSMADSDVIPRTGKWKGISKKIISIGDKKYNMGLFMDFMGWYLSEGSISDRSWNKNESYWAIKIAQEKDAESIEIIFSILTKLFGKHFKVDKWKGGVYVSGKDHDLYKYLKRLGHSHEKYIPKGLKKLSPKYLRRLLRSYFYGDGTVRDNKSINAKKGGSWVANFKPTRIASTSSKKLADDIGELIFKCGKLPSFRLGNKKGTISEHRNGIYASNYDIILVSELNSKNKIFKKRDLFTVENYADKVYCVELPENHILYVRRNGKCTWSGNCRTTTVISTIAASFAFSVSEKMKKIFSDSIRKSFAN